MQTIKRWKKIKRKMMIKLRIDSDSERDKLQNPKHLKRPRQRLLNHEQDRAETKSVLSQTVHHFTGITIPTDSRANV